MLETFAALLVWAVAFYLAIGLLFAILFSLAGARRIDPSAVGGSIGFRLAIIPGAAAFWPLLARRWRTGAPPPEERNPHRDRAHERNGA